MTTQQHFRIDHIAKSIFEIASGNFDYPIERTNHDDELDAIVLGINMLREELRASTVSRDYMDTLFKSVVDLLFVLDDKGNIQNANIAVSKKLGVTESSLVGASFASLVSSRSAAKWNAIDLSQGEIHIDVELYMRPSSGEEIPVSCSLSSLIDKRDHKKDILIIAKDISRQKQVEEELRKSKEKAESANIAKSRFLANMSHEIRTPLNGILGLTDLLLQESKDETQREYLELMRTSGRNLIALINDILDVSKIESDKITLENIPFVFRDTLLSNLHPYKHLAEQKGLCLSYTIDELIPEKLVGDPVRINQVVANLMGNAIKFTEEGSIDVAFSLQEIKDGRAVVKGEVRDTGIGIPAEKIESIFQRFTQADDSMNRKYGGSGLGLTIAKSLVELMGGEMKVHSAQVGKTGTVFLFTINLEIAISQSAEPTLITKKSQKMKFERKVSALIVDDNPVNLLVAQKILTSFGATVQLAENGEIALNLAKANSFDIVLMDIQMPVMDGYTASQKLREMNFTKPILALSANAFAEHKDKSLTSGMNGHLQKPFNPKDLFTAVVELLSGHKSLNSAA